MSREFRICAKAAVSHSLGTLKQSGAAPAGPGPPDQAHQNTPDVNTARYRGRSPPGLTKVGCRCQPPETSSGTPRHSLQRRARTLERPHMAFEKKSNVDV